MPLTKLPSWRLLEAHRSDTTFCLRDFFATDECRATRLSLKCQGLVADISRNLVTEQTLQLLVSLANDRDLTGQIRRLFDGDNVNFTERRPALHMANRSELPQSVDGYRGHLGIRADHERMRAFVDSIQKGELRGYAGQAVRAIIHIGIGGPHLGPAFACKALAGRNRSGLPVHFVSTVDGTALRGLLATLNPATTFAIVASKTFSTEETLANARAIWNWMAHDACDPRSPASNFVAVTGEPEAARAFGIRSDRTFHVWPSTGGRFSLCSAMGLPIALAAGTTAFERLRQGAAAMDTHFRTTPLMQNMPVILGLLDVWYANFFAAGSRIVAPYIDCFDLLPSYLQQVEMESLGKSVNRAGKPTEYGTGMMSWGSAGTNGQHAYMQMLTQGTRFAPLDIIAACRAPHGLADFHVRLLSNALAQAEARMLGQSESDARALLTRRGLAPAEVDALAPHLVLHGNLPCTFILLPEADPFHVGMLAALYEHKVFVESAIWDINAFDQWGVEFAKTLSTHIYAALASIASGTTRNSATDNLIRQIQARQQSSTTDAGRTVHDRQTVKSINTQRPLAA